jgi:DNA integrity scanning protein DisA with diadenylate cyclase activity
MINKRIVDFIKKYNLKGDVVKASLFLIKYKLTIDLIPKKILELCEKENIIRKKIETNIYGNNEVSYSIIEPYNQEEKDFEWVNEFLALFDTTNYPYESCVNNFKLLFKKYPNITKEKIMLATRIYLDETDPEYTKEPQNFIYQYGQSKLMSYIED